MSYQLIRIDKDSIIKIPRKTLGSGDGPLYLFFKPEEDPDEVPLEVGGEIADALRMWISGTKTFPITSGGILDLYGALVNGYKAQQAFTQPQELLAGAFNTRKTGEPFETVDLSDVITDAKTYKPDTVPGLNIDAIARGIRGRKD